MVRCMKVRGRHLLLFELELHAVLPHSSTDLFWLSYVFPEQACDCWTKFWFLRYARNEGKQSGDCERLSIEGITLFTHSHTHILFTHKSTSFISISAKSPSSYSRVAKAPALLSGLQYNGVCHSCYALTTVRGHRDTTTFLVQLAKHVTSFIL
jgi:hypothetical protein